MFTVKIRRHITILNGSIFDCGNLPGELLSYKRLMGMCHWMGSHFHDWSDYNGVAFSIELVEWGPIFSGLWSK